MTIIPQSHPLNGPCALRYSSPLDNLSFAEVVAVTNLLDRITAIGGSVCDVCGQAGQESSRNLKRCGRCKLAAYCGVDCAKVAWKRGHKQACREPGQVKLTQKYFLLKLE